MFASSDDDKAWTSLWGLRRKLWWFVSAGDVCLFKAQSLSIRKPASVKEVLLTLVLFRSRSFPLWSKQPRCRFERGTARLSAGSCWFKHNTNIRWEKRRERGARARQIIITTPSGRHKDEQGQRPSGNNKKRDEREVSIGTNIIHLRAGWEKGLCNLRRDKLL